MFNPSLTVGGFYDSNVFASPTDQRGDVALRVRPSLRAATLWERHALAVQADLQSDIYRQNPGLDQTDVSIRSRGRFDISHDSAILANLRAGYLHEDVGSLSSPTGAVEPTPYGLVSGDLTYWKQFGRFAASAGMRTNSYDYGSTRAQNGTVIDQSSRDGQIYAGHGRLEYVISPKFGVFTALEGNRRELRGTPTQSFSSDGYRGLAGVNIEFTRILTGEIGVGYADQQFDAPTIATHCRSDVSRAADLEPESPHRFQVPG